MNVCIRSQWWNGMNLSKFGSKNKRNNGHKLNKNVKRWSRSIFKRISNCVTNNCSFVNLTSFSNLISMIINECSTLNIFFGIVPCATGVGSWDSHLHSTDNSSREEASKHFWPECKTNKKWTEYNLYYNTKLRVSQEVSFQSMKLW